MATPAIPLAQDSSTATPESSSASSLKMSSEISRTAVLDEGCLRAVTRGLEPGALPKTPSSRMRLYPLVVFEKLVAGKRSASTQSQARHQEAEERKSPFNAVIARFRRILHRNDEGKRRGPHGPRIVAGCRSQEETRRPSLATSLVPLGPTTGLSPFSQALQNCRMTFTVLNQLSKSLICLCEQQMDSDCRTVTAYWSPDVAAYMLDHRLKSTSWGRRDPQSLNQMIRFIFWEKEEIKDELRGLQMRMLYGGTQESEARRTFIERWESTPIEGFGSIRLAGPDLEKFERIGAEELLKECQEGEVCESAAECALDHMPVLYDKLCQTQKAYRSDQGKAAGHGPPVSTLVDMLKGCPGRPSMHARIGRLCKRNIETVMVLLNRLDQEMLEGVQHRRDSCKYGPACPRYRGSCIYLRRAKEQLEGMTSSLSKVQDVVKRPAMFRRPFSNEAMQLLEEWGSLSGNGYGALVTLCMEEVVERLVRKPLPEDEVLQPDSVLKNIPFRLQPVIMPSSWAPRYRM